jgi:hypothetical protein
MELVKVGHKTPPHWLMNLQDKRYLIPKATLQSKRLGKTVQAGIDF